MVVCRCRKETHPGCQGVLVVLCRGRSPGFFRGSKQPWGISRAGVLPWCEPLELLGGAGQGAKMGTEAGGLLET